jgi:membrane-bound lytic murein transglycosylase D
LSEQTFRRVFLATLIGTAFTLSACSTLEHEQAPVAAAIAASAPLGTERALFAPATVEEIPASSLPAALPQPPGPDDYPDLLARIRSGFQLEDVDQRAIDMQLAWYVNHPDYLERTFGRGERYLHYIATQLETRGMPLELALLPIVESAFEPFGYSRARASGLWQFIPGTGKRFGLKQDWWYDGRRDIVESTRAALDYLQFLHDEFNGDWLLAIAAYNSGEVNVQRAVSNNLALNKPTDFWHLKLPRETRAYVPKLLAMARLVRDPQAVGIQFWPIPNEPYFASVETGGQIDLKMASEIAGITMDEMTDLNPAFNRWATDPDGPHRLLLPIEVSEQFRYALSQWPAQARVQLDRHPVKSGDTLSTVARRYGVSVAVLKEINDVKATQLRPGEDLLVPANGAALHPKVALAAARVDGRAPPVNRSGRTHVVRRGDSLWTIARAYGVSVNSLATLNGMQPGDTLRAGRKIKVRGGSGASGPVVVAGNGEHMTYTVRRGDTLSHIARRFSVTVSQLLSWNGLSRHDQIMPGQRIVMFVAPSSGG